jgi:CDP-diacylglycerol---glycerol-3-phosphate 3-phosphatidyltransferase
VNLPNLISTGRIVLALGVPPLLLMEGFTPRLIAFLVFLTAALSDLWDGHLARSRGLVTDLGKLLDPLADKLLMAATFIPLYILSLRGAEGAEFPWFGGVLPLWILIVIFGRELFITLFRSWAARRGVVIAAGSWGKYKTVFQAIFVGAAILWYGLHALAGERGWPGTSAWEGWIVIHRLVAIITLAGAVVLALYSMVVYLLEYRRTAAEV